jgi:hypothetical protein
MMATTHALAGVALAGAVTVLAPELGPVPVAAAALGGLFPDFDMYAGHRRTLHFPVYYALAAVPAVVAAVLVPGPLAAAVALFLAAAALHSASDALGGGLELRPWEATSDRAVYSHYHGRWLPPRRLVRYDGAPEDLALAVGLAVPTLAVFGTDGPVATGVLLAVGVSAAYALLRKPMVAVAERVVAALPPGVRARLPARFVEDLV